MAAAVRELAAQDDDPALRGPDGCRRALPFFFGLVVGEFTAGFLRTVLDLAFDVYLPVDSGIGGCK